jgi:uncharacterized protein (TIGR03066 family)
VKLRFPVLAGMVMLGMSMVAMAGADNAMKIVGVWEVTKSDNAPKGAMAEFSKDGKMKLKAKFGDKEISIDGTYKLKGDKITSVLTFGGKSKEETATIKKLTADVLHIEDEKGKVDEYKRVK